MAKCSKCGKRSLFLKLIDNMCFDCYGSSAAERKKIQLEERLNNTANTSPLSKDLETLSSSRQRSCYPPKIIDGCPAVYRYPWTDVEDVDLSVLVYLFRAQKYRLNVVLQPNGEIHLIASTAFAGERYVGKLFYKIDMCRDWIKRNDPIHCELVAFKPGFVRVSLTFYRDDESRLKSCKMTLAKLTSCMSEEKQDNIACLEKGQKLFVEEDDDGNLYVRDIDYHELGRMPVKFSQMYEDGTLHGLFFDHNETTENSNGDEKSVPYVRFYHDQYK